MGVICKYLVQDKHRMIAITKFIMRLALRKCLILNSIFIGYLNNCTELFHSHIWPRFTI